MQVIAVLDFRIMPRKLEEQFVVGIMDVTSYQHIKYSRKLMYIHIYVGLSTFHTVHAKAKLKLGQFNQEGEANLLMQVDTSLQHQY